MKEITYKIEYTEQMEMKELVDAINQSNESMMTAFNAMMQNQSDLLLGEMKQLRSDTNSRFDKLEDKFDRLARHLGIEE